MSGLIAVPTPTFPPLNRGLLGDKGAFPIEDTTETPELPVRPPVVFARPTG
jgi:hypothetical protein